MIFKPWARASYDPEWDPPFFHAGQADPQDTGDGLTAQHLTVNLDAIVKPLTVAMADVALPSTIPEVGDDGWQPTSHQRLNALLSSTMPPSTATRTPQIRGRLEAMTSFLDDSFQRESSIIKDTKSSIEVVLHDDARQLFLRGIITDGIKNIGENNLYWMDTWNNSWGSGTETRALPQGIPRTPSAYRTFRRRLLLRTLHIQRRALSDRLDLIEKEIAKYGAMRNMDQAWKSAPAFVNFELDANIDAFVSKISKSSAVTLDQQCLQSDKDEYDEFLNVGREHSSLDSTSHTGYERQSLTVRTDQLRRNAAYTEARAQALAGAVALPSPERLFGGYKSASSMNDSTSDSGSISIASETSNGELRRPFMATISSMFGGNKDSDECNKVEASAAAVISEEDPVVLGDSFEAAAGYSGNAEALITPEPFPSTETCEGHQSQSSMSTLNSLESSSSGISYDPDHIPGIKTNVARVDSADIFREVHLREPSQDEETCMLLRFRRALLREWHTWDHIQKCLFNRVDAIRIEHARLQRYIEVVRTSKIHCRPEALASIPTGVSNQDANNLRFRQRERARELGCPPGVIVVNPETPTNAGAFVMVPPAPKGDFASIWTP